MDFDSEIELHGVPVYRYRPAPDVFAMSNPNNFCYCPYFDQCATRVEGKVSISPMFYKQLLR